MDPDQTKVRTRRQEVRIPGLGWLPHEIASQIKLGKVRVDGNWVKPGPKALPSWQQAYELPTEHFLIKSTLPLPKTLELAGDLEALWALWAELFEGLHPLDAFLTDLKAPLKVWILAFTADFASCESSNIPPKAAIGDPPSHGVAHTDTHQAFFSVDPTEYDPSKSTSGVRDTLFHEATHLIHSLFQSAPGASGPGYWCVEGSACLVEGLRDYTSVDLNTAVSTAKHPSVQTPTFPKGLQNLSASLLDLNQIEFGAGDQSLNYCQAMAFAHFFMYAQGGWYRRAFLESLYLIDHDKSLNAFDHAFPGVDKKILVEQVRTHGKKIQ